MLGYEQFMVSWIRITTVHLSTPITQKFFFNQGMLLLATNTFFPVLFFFSDVIFFKTLTAQRGKERD